MTGDPTKRMCLEHSGLVERLDALHADLSSNSKDTREIKKLLVGFLLSLLIACFGYFLRGCGS